MYQSFEGKLDNKSLDDLRSHFLEISQMTSFKQRKKAIQKLMREYDSFFTQYYSDYFDPHLSTSDVLSDHNAVSKALEVLGSFIIYADNEENPVDKSFFDAQLLK